MSDLWTPLEVQEAMGDENEENSMPVIVIANADDSEVTQLVPISSATSTNVDPPLLPAGESSQKCILVDVTNSLLSSNKEQVEPAISLNKNKSDVICSNYVYQILQKTYEGNFQIASYLFESNEENKKKLLDTKRTLYFSKSKVAKLIIFHEFHRTNSYDISSERLLGLAKLTAELFPPLLPESFYTKACTTKSAGGALQTVYAKQREKELAIGRLQPQRKRKIIDAGAECQALQILEKQVNIIDEEYTKLWSVTAVAEREAFYSSNDLKKILEKLPNLTHPLGFLLIKADFTTYFNKTTDTFLQKFTDIAPKIIAIAKTKRDAEIKAILAENTPCISDEQKRTVALVVLPYLFKRAAKVTSRSKSSSNWTPQHHEVLNTFIIHLKTSDRLQESLKEEQSKVLELYNNHKLIVRPFVIIKGSNLKDIDSAFVIAGPIKYQVASASLAIDICFQLQKVLHEPFSIICNHVWQFLERKVYEFQVKNLYTSVTALIEKLS